MRIEQEQHRNRHAAGAPDRRIADQHFRTVHRDHDDLVVRRELEAGERGREAPAHVVKLAIGEGAALENQPLVFAEFFEVVPRQGSQVHRLFF